jgi:hypothetical protein
LKSQKTEKTQEKTEKTQKKTEKKENLEKKRSKTVGVLRRFEIVETVETF